MTDDQIREWNGEIKKMKESEMMDKICPELSKALGCFTKCQGSECAMWEQEWRREKVELTEDIEPDGEGWEKIGADSRGKGQLKSIVWLRYVPIDEGDCGLKSKEQGCFYPG